MTICLLEVFISFLAFMYCCLALCVEGFVLEHTAELAQQQFAISQNLPYTHQHDSPQEQQLFGRQDSPLQEQQLVSL